MKAEYRNSDSFDRIVLTMTGNEKRKIRQWQKTNPDEPGSLESHWLDKLVCTAKLVGTPLVLLPPDIDLGDLTEAPAVGILGDPAPGPLGERADGQQPYGLVYDGCRTDELGVDVEYYRPVLFRWRWMQYQVYDLVNYLLDEPAVLDGGALLDPETYFVQAFAE